MNNKAGVTFEQHGWDTFYVIAGRGLKRFKSMKADVNRVPKHVSKKRSSYCSNRAELTPT